MRMNPNNVASWSKGCLLYTSPSPRDRQKSREDESEQRCYMVQGNDSLEVNSETHLDDCSSSSGDDLVDAEMKNFPLFVKNY